MKWKTAKIKHITLCPYCIAEDFGNIYEGRITEGKCEECGEEDNCRDCLLVEE